MDGIYPTEKLSMRQLRAIVAIAERHTLVGAARDLNLTQSAVTKTLKEAEAILGFALFTRANRGVRLTQCGEALVRHANIVLTQLETAVEELVDLRCAMRGRVIVGTLLTASARLLPDAICRVHRERPNLTIAVIESTSDVLLPGLKSGEIDFVVGRLSHDRQPDVLTQEALLRDEACVVVRPGHPLSAQHSLRLSDLLRFPWIMPNMDWDFRGEVSRLFGQEGLEPPVYAVESTSILTSKRLLLESDCVSIWPGQLAYHDEDERPVAILSIRLPSANAMIGLIRRANAAPSPAALVCMRALRDAARSPSASTGALGASGAVMPP